jgi:hypothetical protein
MSWQSRSLGAASVRLVRLEQSHHIMKLTQENQPPAPLG